jgi:hypothetical protein
VKARLVTGQLLKGIVVALQVDDEKEENGKMSDKCKKKNKFSQSTKKISLLSLKFRGKKIVYLVVYRTYKAPTFPTGLDILPTEAEFMNVTYNFVEVSGHNLGSSQKVMVYAGCSCLPIAKYFYRCTIWCEIGELVPCQEARGLCGCGCPTKYFYWSTI